MLIFHQKKKFLAIFFRTEQQITISKNYFYVGCLTEKIH